ncbi:MAG: nucleotidyltransferase family protein [Eubacterium sp.]
MNNISTKEEYLVYLLHCAFNKKKAEFAEGLDYSALLELAKSHQVLNAVIPTLTDIDGLPPYIAEELRVYNLNCVRSALMHNSERAAIFDELTGQGIRFMPLKGYIIRNYYPKQSMRQMGDTDIYFDKANRDAVAGIMANRGYTNFSSIENSDDYKNEAGLVFEFHWDLFYDEADFNPVFYNLWEHGTTDDNNPLMYNMGINDLYVHSVCHMYKHYSTGGCGIRFLADTYLMLRRDNDNLDWQWINSKMQEYGIADFERSVRELVFAMFDDCKLDAQQRALLDTFLTFGIFGCERNKVSARVRHFANGEEINNNMRAKYIFSRLFPSKKKMTEDYSILNKHGYLLPAFYVYRFFRAITHIKRTFKEIDYINNSD